MRIPNNRSSISKTLKIIKNVVEFLLNLDFF